MANEAEEGKKSKFKFTPSNLLGNIEARHSVKNTAIKSGAQIVIGVGGGAIGTAILGKYAFLTGLGLIVLGNYKSISWLAPLGTGMMASSLLLAEEATGLNGVEGFDFKTEASKATKRLTDLKDNFLRQTHLDKVFTGKPADKKGSGSSSQRKTESNTEDAPDQMNGVNNLPASTELDNIEKQLMASALAFQQKQQGEKQVNGIDPDLMGLESEVDFSSM